MHSANPFVFGKFMSVQRTDLGAFGAIWVGIWVGTLVSLQVNPLPDDMGDLAWGIRNRRAVNQHALARFDLSGTLQHLVRRDVVQHETDSLGGVQPSWHRNQLPVRQADELRVSTVDRQRGNYLARFDSSD